MDQIIRPNAGVLNILRKRRTAGSDYRMLKYVIDKEVEEGYLLLNTFTKELLLLTREEYDNRLENEHLRQNWFVVPDRTDERELVKLVRLIVASQQGIYINRYKVLTTTECNARCFYCYEHGCAKLTMDEETAQKTAEYIIKNHGGQEVTVTWFGGEPLCNARVIDIICKRLQEAGVRYESKMYSNGYLFDDDMVDKAVNTWRLESLHITLDGTEKVYNKTKAFIYKTGSAYQKVMQNIERLLAAGIRVIIRLNIDLNNAEDLMALVDVLTARFGDKKGVEVYAFPIYDESVVQAERYSKEKLDLLNKKLLDIKSKIENGLTYARHERLDTRIVYNCCTADCDHATTVMPDGSLTPCNHKGDRIGHVASEELDRELVESWKELCEDLPECQDCAFYPGCIRLKKCTNPLSCVDSLRGFKRRNAEKVMVKELGYWKSANA